LNEKYKEMRASLAETDDSLSADAKSTAGDKHETGRAMAQLEPTAPVVSREHILLRSKISLVTLIFSFVSMLFYIYSILDYLLVCSKVFYYRYNVLLQGLLYYTQVEH